MYAACIVNENYRHACKSHMCGTCVTCMHTNYCVLHASYLHMCKPHVCYISKLHTYVHVAMVQNVRCLNICRLCCYDVILVSFDLIK